MKTESKKLIKQAFVLGFKQLNIKVEDRAIDAATGILAAQLDFTIDALIDGDGLRTSELVAHVAKNILPIFNIQGEQGKCVGGVIALAIDVGITLVSTPSCATVIMCSVVALQALCVIQDAVQLYGTCKMAFPPSPTTGKDAAKANANYQSFKVMSQHGAKRVVTPGPAVMLA